MGSKKDSRVGLFLQVRIDSSRLPGKALMFLQDKTLLEWCLSRLNDTDVDVKAILTTKYSVRYLSPIAKKYGWHIFVGSREDLLLRYTKAAKHFNVDTVIRATGDNPFLSSEVVVETLDLFNQSEADISHLTNLPYGSGVEVVKISALIKANSEAAIHYDREHVTPYIYKNSNIFKVVCRDSSDELLRRGDVRITVDTDEDYKRVSILAKTMVESGIEMTLKNIIFTYDKIDWNNQYFNYNEKILLFNKEITTLCPSCGTIITELKYNNEAFDIYYCQKCDLYYTVGTNDYKEIYVDRYFVEEYREQYGKTYEEDKKNIQKFGLLRLDSIKSYFKNVKGLKLLEYGSGLGFFSELCEKEGISTLSLDISNYAVSYIQEKLKFEAILDNGSYLEKNDVKFDIITSFYVIEHIKDFEKLLYLFSYHLNKNGVLALSTPNGSGFSVKYNFDEYKNSHPKDHFYIFTPKFLKRELKQLGFKNIKIEITGHHPERFFKSKKIDNKFLMKICLLISKIFKLGDTFEIYAQKR